MKKIKWPLIQLKRTLWEKRDNWKLCPLRVAVDFGLECPAYPIDISAQAGPAHFDWNEFYVWPAGQPAHAHVCIWQSGWYHIKLCWQQLPVSDNVTDFADLEKCSLVLILS